MASPNTKRNRKEDIEENELYSTPLIALESFYKQYPEEFDKHDVYLDPCDGLGHISDFLESIGKKVYRWDIEDYRGAITQQSDFLLADEIPEDVDCIIMNPPFTMTEDFVDKALSLCPNLIMFNRMTTIETNSRSKKLKSGEWPLKDFYQFGFRVSCPKGVELEPTANSVAYAWLSFDRYCKHKPFMNWITKEEK